MGPDKANSVMTHAMVSRTTRTVAANAAAMARGKAEGTRFISKSNKESGIQILRLHQHVG